MGHRVGSWWHRGDITRAPIWAEIELEQKPTLPTGHGGIVLRLTHWTTYLYLLTDWSVDEKCTVISRLIFTHVVYLAMSALCMVLTDQSVHVRLCR